MVIKQKLSDVAADFGKKNKELIDLLADYTDGPPKKANNVLTEQDLDIIIDKLTASSVIDDADKYLERFAKKGGQKPAKKQQSKKQQAQAAILQMAEQAAKRAEEKAKKKAETVPQARTKGAAHHVDTRSSNVDLEKYNQKYEDIAPSRSISDLSTKQKLNQKSKQYRKKRPQGMHAHSKRETEQQRLARIKEQRKKQQIVVKIPEEITIGELASLLRMTAAEVIKKAFQLGVTATINETIDFDTAEIIAIELGAKVEKKVERSIEEQIIEDTQDTDENTVPRSPVVCVMGHVDHGKTSILDAIRHTSVTDTEAGGITQHIGAYQVNCGGQRITFLDTPGHAAFTAMRARGAMATDIAVLVVAADDGIMPQTVEAINHAKAADVTIIVAVNKIDKVGADINRVKQDLTNYGLVPEEWGGDTIVCPVSAKTGEGVDNLLENILLVAEMKELLANPEREARGTIIEAKLDKGMGPMASVLVQNGTLHTGDNIISGTVTGRVRAMIDENGRQVKAAGPSTAVSVLGFEDVPGAGEPIYAVSQELMKQVIEERKRKESEARVQQTSKITLDDVFGKIAEGNMKTLNLIIKGDVQGSVEAVKQSVVKLSNDEVQVKVIHSGAGAVNESDVMLADSSDAIILAFNVRPDAKARALAERSKVDVRTYRIIYDLLDDISAALNGMLAPKYQEIYMGKCEVRQVFRITGVGNVAGCYVTDGKIVRGGKLRIYRDDVLVVEGNVKQLKRFKDDVKEVNYGFECGCAIDGFNDIRIGDVIECYIIQEIPRK